NVELPVTVLNEAAKSLQEVTVQSTRPFVETKIDKTVVNVDASPTSAGATALEILEKSPGVIVSSEGAISLRGKQGVIVMLDGKPTYLSATDLANLLRNMPASQLDQIEIMTNPSAKYDASGNSGIINIKTKKGRAAGFNGSIMVGAGTSIYSRDGETYFRPKSQNSFNFNYKKGDLNLFGNYNPNIFRGMNTMDISSRMIYQDQTVGYTDQQTKFMFGNNNHTLKLGADWTASKKNLFGVVVSGFVFNGHPTPTTINNIRDVNKNLEKQLISYTDNDIGFKNFTGNLNWKHNFDTTGQELTMDFDAVYYRNASDMLLTTDIYDSNLDYESTSYLKGHLPADIDIYSFKTDYVKPLKNGKLEAGLKTSFVKNDNEVDYQNFDGLKWERDVIRSNHFIYEENINAAYVSVNRKMKKWSAQAGLRVENTISKGDQVTKNVVFKRNRTDFFPTAFVSYEVNKNNQLTVSFGRRIQRPNYNDLNPFLFFLDTLSYRQGNIHLTPQYAHNIELSHAFKGKFITTVSYNLTDDIISQIIKPKEESQGKIRYLTPDNVSQLRNMALSLTAPLKLNAWWNTNLFTTVFNNHYTGVIDTTDIELEYTSFTVNITNTFTIGKGFTAELGGFYRHKSIEQLARMEPIYQLTVGAQKQVMKGKGTVRLNVRDPFAWMKFEGWNNYANVDLRFHSRPDIRQVNASFTYRFGKNGQNGQPRRRTTGSQDEQNRVGQGGQQ
ncbi:MAG TPA: outer membrane beta-barrel family protein, partial [Chitinophagaceae bacterium]